MIIKILYIITIFSAGIVISGAVFAFIIIIGIIPMIITKTDTKDHINTFENVIIVSGILGTITEFINFTFKLPYIVSVIYGLSSGVFIGCLAVSLAETLNVLPIVFRRLKINYGIGYIILSIAIGKMLGSILTVTQSLLYSM